MVICPNNPAQLGVTLPYDGTHSQFTVVPSQSVTQTSNGRTEDDDAATLRRCCRLYLYMRLTRIHLSDVDSNHTIPDCRNVVAELGRKAEGRKARQLSWQLLAVARSLTHSLIHPPVPVIFLSTFGIIQYCRLHLYIKPWNPCYRYTLSGDLW